MAGLNASHLATMDVASRQQQRQQFLGLTAWDRHKRMVHDYVTYYGGQLPTNAAGQFAPQRTDFDALKEGYRFIRSDADDAEGGSWEVRLARRYYSRLFKEYAIADLSRHKEGKVGLRWRTQAEVVAGRGHFFCGAKGCEERRSLASFEVPFGYLEAGQRKQALVKVRVCPEHAYQLNYRKNKEMEERQERESKKEERRRRHREDVSDKGDSEHGHGSKKRRRRGDGTTPGSSGDEGEPGGSGSRRQSGRRVEYGPPAPAADNSADAAADEFDQFCVGLFL